MIKAVGTTRGPVTFTESLSMCDPGRRIVPDRVMRGSRARGVGHASVTAVDLVDRAGLCRTAPDFACTRSKIKPSYLTSRPLAQSSIIAREVSSSAVPAFVDGSCNHSPVAPSAGRGRGAWLAEAESGRFRPVVGGRAHLVLQTRLSRGPTHRRISTWR